VNELGGEANEPMLVLGMGWFSACKDPHGNEFGLWQTDTSAPPPPAVGECSGKVSPLAPGAAARPAKLRFRVRHHRVSFPELVLHPERPATGLSREGGPAPIGSNERANEASGRIC
jgi:hypothetical protein